MSQKQKLAIKTIMPLHNACIAITDALKEFDFLTKIVATTQTYKSTGKVKLSGISTGYKVLDDILDGFQEEQLITLAGRTGMGKTWIALNFLKNIAIDQSIPVSLFSLEMSTTQLFYRLLSLCSEIPAKRIKEGKLNENEINKIISAYTKINNSPIFLSDQASNGDLNNLKHTIDFECTRSKFIIIDHIGLIKEYTESNNRAHEVGEITRTLKIASKDHKIPIMCLAQLNRNADKDEKPKLSELRESGAIEQDSDVVIFVHRSDYHEKDKKTNEVTLIIAKNRDGEQGNSITLKRDDVWRLNERNYNEIHKLNTSLPWRE